MNNLTGFLRILVAISLLFGLFYIRLIPRASRDLWENMTNQQLFLTLFTITLILLNIYSILKTLGYIKPKVNKIIEKLTPIINNLIEFLIKSFLMVYNAIWYLIEHVSSRYFNIDCMHYEILRRFLIVANKPKYLKYYALGLLSLQYLPRIVFLLALSVDVFIYQHFDYTFRSIPLLLLPLLEKFIVFVFTDYYESHSDDTYFLMQKQYIPEKKTFRYSFKPEFENNPPPYVKDFGDYFDNHFKVFSDLEDSLDSYFTLKNNIIFSNLTLFLSISRLTVYIYILFYGIL